MKKVLLPLMVLVTIGTSGVFMVEDYTEDSLYFPTAVTYKLASVTFQLDQFSIATVIADGIWYSTSGNICSWLVLNEDSLGMSTCLWLEAPSFMIELETGVHTLDLMVRIFGVNGYAINPRLQVLIHYNDDGGISEAPPGITPIESRSVLSSGAAVIVPECTEVIDLTGRIVSSNPPQGRIELSNFSAGTYLARTQNGRTIKIVKL